MLKGSKQMPHSGEEGWRTGVRQTVLGNLAEGVVGCVGGGVVGEEA